MINSILDNDFYKFLMQQAVVRKFPKAETEYSFINRGNHNFTRSMVEDIKYTVDLMENLKLTDDEFIFLKRMNIFNPVYLEIIKNYKYNTNEVSITYDEDIKNLKISINGYWFKTILWEVPIMAIVSEVYNRHIKPEYQYNNKKDIDKFNKLAENNINFADFGTRRRINFNNHNRIVDLVRDYPNFIGTSNLYFAKKYNIEPIGTQAHEWFMFHGAKYGYRIANEIALKNWLEVFNGEKAIALTDTYTTDIFFLNFNRELSNNYEGVRQDSGDPKLFADNIINHYKSLNIDPKNKMIIFSDSLNAEKAIELKKYCGDRIKCSFGIGTNLTNDIKGITPLNFVIKMRKAREQNKYQANTIKLSDTTGKISGNPEEVKACQIQLNLS